MYFYVLVYVFYGTHFSSFLLDFYVRSVYSIVFLKIQWIVGLWTKFCETSSEYLDTNKNIR